MEHKIKTAPGKASYKKFFIKLFIFLAIVVVLDIAIGATLRHYYFKQESGVQYRTTYSMEQTKADVLIFGSSRATHHYVPDIFEKRLNMSYYNVGRDGNFIFYHYAVLKSVLKRYTPKIIILDISGGEFSVSQDSYDRLSALLPYYKEHPEIRPIVELKSDYEKVKLVSSIYPYNSSLITIALGNVSFNKKRNDDTEGYLPLKKNWNLPLEDLGMLPNYDLDSVKMKAFDSFITDCKAANIELYVVCSPQYRKAQNTDYSVLNAKQMAEKHNVPFRDFYDDTSFINHVRLFADAAHLNDSGARVFSNIMVDDLLKAKGGVVTK
jgi:hypothetical protein